MPAPDNVCWLMGNGANNPLLLIHGFWGSLIFTYALSCDIHYKKSTELLLFTHSFVAYFQFLVKFWLAFAPVIQMVWTVDLAVLCGKCN